MGRLLAYVRRTNDFTEVETAIRKVVDANLNEKEFHHVLTELAFLQIRYKHLKGAHGIIPMLLNSKAEQCLPKFIINSTTIRIEESIWRTPNMWEGRQTYQDEGLHVGFFRLLKQLLVKQERCIALIEEKIYRGCLQRLREDSAHTLTSEEFFLFLNQTCVMALEALKREHSADLRELNGQKAIESILTEIKQLNGELLVAPDQLHSALEESYSAKRLAIQRLSGPPLSMEHCYINLAIVEYEKTFKEEGSSQEGGEKAQSDYLYRSSSAEAMNSEQQKLVLLKNLFEPRELRDDKTITPKRILIRGRAGVGKTTLSKKIVYEYTQKGQWRDRFDYVLWIPLRALKGRQDCDLEKLFYETYFQHHLKGRSLAKTLLAQIKGPAKERTLFILDGWDEVAQEWDEQKLMAAFLKELLNQPAVLITSRPYTDLKQADPMDVELEAVGFSPESVAAYLDNQALTPAAQAKEMKDFMQTNSFIQSLVNVPIQLDALCYSWDEIKRLQQQTQGMVTVTALYQAIVNKLWRKDILWLGKSEAGKPITESQVNALKRPSRIEKLVKTEQNFLSTLAFRGLQRNQIEFKDLDLDALLEQLETQGVDLPITLEDNLKKLSFLHTDNAEKGQPSYHFMHLTFQEFFAAKHFVQCWETGQQIALLSIDSKQWTKAAPEALVRQHKYNPRYEIFWRFVSGLLRGEALNRFFTVLEAEPRDLFGVTHQHLIMNNLHEASGDTETGLSPEIRNRLEQGLGQWLKLEIDKLGIYENTLAYSLTLPESLLYECLREARSENTKLIIARACRQRSVLSDATAQALSALMTMGSLSLRLAAIEALGKSSLPVSVLEALIELTRNKYWDVKSAAAKALSQQSSLSPPVLEALMALMKGKDQRGVRRTLLDSLVKHASVPAVFEALITLTTDGSEDVKRDVAKVLGQQSSLPLWALDILVALTRDKKWSVREEATKALGKSSSLPPSVLEAMVTLIKDGDKDIRCAAAKVLVKQSPLPDWVLNALIKLMKDDDKNVKQGTVEALGRASSLPPLVFDALVALAKDGDDGVRYAVAEALERWPSLTESAFDALIALTKDKNDNVKRVAAGALGKQRLFKVSMFDALIALTKNENNGVRRTAAEALGKQSSLPISALAALIELMKHAIKSVRDAAAEALGKQSSLPVSALAALIELMKSDLKAVRSTATWVLDKQASLPTSAFGALIELTKSEYKDVKLAAVEALGQQSLPQTSAALDTLIELAKGEYKGARLAAVKALGQQSLSQTSAALGALIELTKDKSVRLAVIEALGKQPSLPPSALDALIELIKGKDSDARGAATMVLSQQSSLPDKALDALLALMKDKDLSVGRAATMVLSQKSLLSASALDALTALMNHEDKDVRYAAAEALVEPSLLSTPAFEVLVTSMDDKRSYVREHTVKLLGKQSLLSPSVFKALTELLKDKEMSVMSTAI